MSKYRETQVMIVFLALAVVTSPASLVAAGGHAPGEKLRESLQAEPVDRQMFAAAIEEFLQKDNASSQEIIEILLEEGFVYRAATHGGIIELESMLRKHRASTSTNRLVLAYFEGEYLKHEGRPGWERVFSVFVRSAAEVLPDEQAVKVLAKLWNDKQYTSPPSGKRARYAVVAALIRVGSDAAFEALDKRLDEAPFGTLALRALSACPNDRAVDYLLYILERTDDVLVRIGHLGYDEVPEPKDEWMIRSRDRWARVMRTQCLRALCGDPRLDQISEARHIPTVEKMGVPEWSLGMLVYAKAEVTRLAPDLAVAGLESEVDEALSKLDAIIEERRERHKRGHSHNGE